METIESILENIGYKLINHGYYYTTNALYREGSDPTSLTIYPNKNIVMDWVTGEKMSIQSLIMKSLKLEDPNKIKEWLKNKNVIINTEKPEPKIDEPRVFPIEYIENLKPDHSYWINRGVNENTLKEFGGGLWVKDGFLKNYYVFPVWDAQKRLVGLAGRNTDSNSNKPKWKLKGDKKLWKYPLFLNHQEIIKRKQVILIESIGNCLSLYDVGCKNTMVMFGVELSFEIINYLLKFNINNIIVSTDNDEQAGKYAAQKIYKKVGKYFDKHSIKIKFPYRKDFSEQSLEENKKWVEENVRN